MSIGLTQLIFLIIIAIILFGNIPKIFKDLSAGILTFKQTLAKTETPSSEPKTQSPIELASSTKSSEQASKSNADNKAC